MSSVLKDLVQSFTRSISCGEHDDEELLRIAAEERRIFRYKTIIAATKKFNPSRKLGEGGFGPVYKGMLRDGREIAVKRLSQRSNQGRKEFMNEAKLLTRLQHRNVVQLLGYCAHGTERLLVYEYASNESLDKVLFNPESHMRRQLHWGQRFSIIKGIASGLRYLHGEFHSCIIHRDIKASNVLLDGRWVPKIADFGMARLCPEDQTHLDTRLIGTWGYMDPQYLNGILSEKTDVYSFGVLVLELISGQQSSTFILNMDVHLVDWAFKLYVEERSLEIMDPTLADSEVTEQVAMCIQLGLLCTQYEPRLRPSMERVVSILEGCGRMEEPTRLGVFHRNNADRNNPMWWTCVTDFPTRPLGYESAQTSDRDIEHTTCTQKCSQRGDSKGYEI